MHHRAFHPKHSPRTLVIPNEQKDPHPLLCLALEQLPHIGESAVRVLLPPEQADAGRFNHSFLLLKLSRLAGVWTITQPANGLRCTEVKITIDTLIDQSHLNAELVYKREHLTLDKITSSHI